MKSICLCIKIHLPVIYQKQHFSELNPEFRFYHIDQTAKYIAELADSRLIPFLKSVQRVSNHSKSGLRLGISISGISVRLLEEYAPHALEILQQLSSDNTLDFFAEPWSHSILPFFDRKELVSQTGLHRKVISDYFEKTPFIFVSHSPFQSDNFLNFVTDTGYQTLFTYSNYTRRKTWHLRTNSDENHPRGIFYINHLLSEKLQSHAGMPDIESETKTLIPFVRYSRKHASLVKPLILFFDPLQKNLHDFGNWELIVNALLRKTGGTFYSLSDLAEISNYFAVENNFSNAMLSQFELPNFWMKNNMQREAFKQFQVIFELVKQGEHPYLTEAWNFLQDLNNFFYMSDSFFIESFAEQYFNPFTSPHEAFTNYMNAASRFWHLKKTNRRQLSSDNKFLFASSN